MKIKRYLFSRNYKQIILFLTFTCLLLLVVISLKTILKENYLSQSVSAQTQECTADDTLNWCQIQHNPQRTGYTPATLGTNFKVAWTRAFQPEKVFPQVQAIVYQGKVFVGTETGNMYALNAATGQQAWKFTAGGPILASVAAGNGNVYFGSLDGAIYAVNANTGVQVWKKQLSDDRGFTTAPVLADNKIMLGSQEGIFYALDPTNGNVFWQYNAGFPILQTAAYNNGRVFFGTMDMYVYALNTAGGTLSWKSAKINAMAFKDYWPVISSGKVFIRAMQTGINFFAFDENTGARVLTNLPQKDSATMNGAVTPPCIEGNGYLVVPVEKGSYGTMWGRVDPQTGNIFDDFNDGTNLRSEDETTNVTCSSNLILAFHASEQGQYHAGYNGFFNLNSRTWTEVPIPQQVNSLLSGGWGSASGNPPTIANSMVYHIVFHAVIARTTQ